MVITQVNGYPTTIKVRSGFLKQYTVFIVIVMCGKPLSGSPVVQLCSVQHQLWQKPFENI